MPNYQEDPNKNTNPYPGRGGGRGYGRGQGRGQGRGRGRGRPPIAYPIDYSLSRQGSSTVILSSFELKILQMSDSQDLTQNEIAEQLDISQTSVWRYLKSARTKIAQAITENNHIYIEIVD